VNGKALVLITRRRRRRRRTTTTTFVALGDQFLGLKTKHQSLKNIVLLIKL